MNVIGRLKELVEDWTFLYRRDGAIKTLPLLAVEIIHLPFRHLNFLVFSFDLNRPLPELRAKIELEIRPFHEGDLAEIRVINRPSEAAQCARHLARGQRGLIAIHKGRVAGYAWGCTENDPESETIHLPLDPGDVLCTDVYTSPEFRGKGIQTALTMERIKLFRGLGYRRGLCYIETGNSPSLAVWQRKLSAHLMGKVNFWRIGPWYRIKIEQARGRDL